MSSFQHRVHHWVVTTFGGPVDPLERSRRFLEEALELVQAAGLAQVEALRLVEYVYSRPKGDVVQEMGGTRVSLAALAASLWVDADTAGEAELARLSAPGMEDVMRERQRQKVDKGIARWPA